MNTDGLNVLSQIADNLEKMFHDKGAEQGDVLQRVLDSTRELLDAKICALFLTDFPGQSLVLEKVSGEIDFEKIKDVATYDIKDYANKDQRCTGVTPWVLHRKKPFNARNFDELVNNSEGHWKGNWDTPMYSGNEKASENFQCVYMVPLLAGNKAIGVLKYENRAGDKAYFGRSDEQLINVIAGLVTNLVISQRIERNRYNQILPKISSILVSHFGQAAFYEKLLEECRSILSADLCSLFLLDDHDNLILKAIMGVTDEVKTQLRDFAYNNYKSAKGLTPWILTRQAPFNVRSFPDLKGRSEGKHIGQWDGTVYHGKPEQEFKSLYSIPLVIGKEPIGVFKVENKNVPPYYFTENDERLFDLIGTLIAVGVKYQNAEYFGIMLKAAELGFLAAGISHEFNNYLQRFLLIAGNAEDICSEQPVKGKLNQIMKEITEASEVIDDFRQIRKREQKVEVFNPDSVIEQIIDLSRQRFRDHDVEVEYDNQGVFEVSLNLSELQTIVINLVKNAFESITDSKGSGVIAVSVRSISIHRFCIEIADSGRGVSQDEREHIFAPFYTTKAPKGTGFGLFWVQRIVNSMDGVIDIKSPNHLSGATFSVTLPKNIEQREEMNV